MRRRRCFNALLVSCQDRSIVPVPIAEPASPRSPPARGSENANKGSSESNSNSAPASSTGAQVERFRVDASKSQFTARVGVGGLLSALGHEHVVAIRDFTGEAIETLHANTNSSVYSQSPNKSGARRLQKIVIGDAPSATLE